MASTGKRLLSLVRESSEIKARDARQAKSHVEHTARTENGLTRFSRDITHSPTANSVEAPPKRDVHQDANTATVYATVALPLPFKFHSGGGDGLTYKVPPELLDRARPGTRVLVPLGKRERTGVLVHVTHQAPEMSARIRPIIDVLDPQPVFDEDFLQWSKWVATYYMSSWGEVLAAALPEGLKPETKSIVRLAHESSAFQLDEIAKRAPRRAEILKAIASFENGVAINHLQKQLDSKSLYAALHALEDQGLIVVERPLARQAKAKKEQVVKLADGLRVGSEELSQALSDLEQQAPRQANILLALVQQMQMHPDEPLSPQLLMKKAGANAATFKSLREKGYVQLVAKPKSATPTLDREVLSDDDITKITLTDEQKYAVKQIEEQIHLGQHKSFLLHGVTGSGKTEVYIGLARKVLSEGNGVLILVPEIALTPQLIERFKKRLSIKNDSEIAVLHSRMSMGERYVSWKSLVDGTVRIAIGARSAVFAPIKKLKLIVVDEEHEATYKQYDKTPRYNARDIAMLKAVCVLGSATPSLESYYNAHEGKYELIRLTQRAKEAKLPKVRIVDLRTAANRKDFKAARNSLTPDLRTAIQQRIENKEGVVLFQNRRGFSTYLECGDCGTPEMCPNCAVTMTFHKPKQQMRCHYCGFYMPKRATCGTCGSENLRLGGMGTQRVEEDINASFPDARVVRMDLDTTAKKGSFKKILSSFAAGEADILLGTQMVAKGLDFPRVTLVGVVSADTSLCLPDFRAAERTFQLLTQVSGRAGRSEELAGEVLIQTLQPDNPSIELAAAHDYERFFQMEISDRAKLQYPPFSRFILIEFRGLHEQAVKERAEAFASLFPEKASFYERIGPAAPSIAKLRNEFRWHVLLKNYKRQDASGEKIRRLITGAIEQYQKRFASQNVKLTVDVDVQGVM
jgi:primosomal protein N' (replication factor Y) (superfamily II helicase)